MSTSYAAGASPRDVVLTVHPVGGDEAGDARADDGDARAHAPSPHQPPVGSIGDVPSGAGRRVATVASPTCPHCGSSFLQPLRCEAQGEDAVLVELRCADCTIWISEPHTRAEMRELDRRQAEWRQLLLDAYERSVSETMLELAALFGVALSLDLIGADDFAPRRFARTG